MQWILHHKSLLSFLVPHLLMPHERREIQGGLGQVFDSNSVEMPEKKNDLFDKNPLILSPGIRQHTMHMHYTHECLGTLRASLIYCLQGGQRGPLGKRMACY